MTRRYRPVINGRFLARLKSIELPVQPREPLKDTLHWIVFRVGRYYGDLTLSWVCPYVIGSEIFGQGSEHEDWLLGYFETHGGITMGMIRSQPHQGHSSAASRASTHSTDCDISSHCCAATNAKKRWSAFMGSSPRA